jgi:hypothetical protein
MDYIIEETSVGLDVEQTASGDHNERRAG